MAKITRLASTLIARYYPSKVYTDAFYMDGRLTNKREVRNADITIDKEEKGFFFSVFSHPTIQGYEPGMIPPYEPQLRGICNEVKFGRKPIDAMISGFLTTAVDITGKMKLQEQDSRAPYFSGIIVHDAEAFAVTIGSGLAFLYRNDTLYPLTDAGIPMEPIDAYGNRVGDFYNYVSSKTANALWSNITTLSVDDCIILCNKAVYDALGQRELLRILDEADDQCDAAGTVITQAAANMPNIPMQFSISFVESITADEKKGLFGFRKKNKEEDTSNMSIKSTVDGGIIGAAAEAIAGAGFVSGIDEAVEAGAAAEAAGEAAGVSFGDFDMPKTAVIPDLDSVSFSNFVVPEEPAAPDKDAPKVEFLDTSVEKPVIEEVSADDLMKTLVGQMNESKKEGLDIQKKAEEIAKQADATPAPVVSDVSEEPLGKITEGITTVPETPEIPSDSPFVSAFNPFENPPEVKESEMEKVSETAFEPETDDSMMDTKTVSSFESLFANQVKKESGIASDGIIAAALKELKEEVDATKPSEETNEEVKAEDKAEEVKEEVKVETVSEEKKEETVEEKPQAMPVTVNNDEIVFSMGEKVESFKEEVKEDKPFDPYSVGNTDDIEDNKSVVFPAGDFGGFDLSTQDNNATGGDSAMSDNENNLNGPSFDWKEEGLPDQPLSDEVPVPEFKIVPENATVNPVENVSFPLSQQETAPVQPAPQPAAPVSDNDFVIPFENAVYAEPEAAPVQDDIPDMPVFGSQSYDSPVYAVNSEQPAGDDSIDAYEVGSYEENEDMAPEPAPYQSYGSESFEPETAVNEDPYAASDPYAEQYAQPSYQEQPSYAEPEQYAEPAPQTYENGAYSEQPDFEAAAATTAAASAASAASASLDDDWINSLIDSGSDEPIAPPPQRPGAQSRPRPQQRSSAGGSGAGGQRRPAGSPQSRPQPGRGGNGGRGGNNKPFKLSRNGAIFLVFVGVLFLALILIIVLIAKSCSSDKKKEAEATKETEATEVVIETTPAPVVEVDPTAPIGAFQFSDYTGYRTWWDLFTKVYNIEIEGDTDSRIEIIRQYNGVDSSYMPASGDKLILPPIEVINGSVKLDGSSAETTETQADGSLSGEPSLEGSGETEATSETSA